MARITQLWVNGRVGAKLREFHERTKTAIMVPGMRPTALLAMSPDVTTRAPEHATTSHNTSKTTGCCCSASARIKSNLLQRLYWSTVAPLKWSSRPLIVASGKLSPTIERDTGHGGVARWRTMVCRCKFRKRSVSFQTADA